MKGIAKLFAVLLLAFAPAALTPVAPAQAQNNGGDDHRRGEGRGGEGRSERRDERRDENRGGSAPRQAYPAPSYGGGPAYGSPAPYPGAVYPPGPVYAPPPGYAYPYQPPPPGYAANSLGAQWGQQQDQARSGVRRGGLMPLGQVVQRVNQVARGRILDAGLEPGPDGRPAYRVRWAATGGRRMDFIVDAVSGAILARTGY
jgi:hypothetical protein